MQPRNLSVKYPATSRPFGGPKGLLVAGYLTLKWKLKWTLKNSASSRVPSLLRVCVYGIDTPRLHRTYYRVYFSAPLSSLLPVAFGVTVFPRTLSSLSLCLSLMVASFSLNLCMFPLSTSEKLRGGSALVWHIKQARCLLRDIKYYPFFFFFTILVNILIGIHHPLSCRESPLTIRGNRRGQSDRAGAKELIAKQPLWNVFDLVFDLPTKIF